MSPRCSKRIRFKSTSGFKRGLLFVVADGAIFGHRAEPGHLRNIQQLNLGSIIDHHNAFACIFLWLGQKLGNLLAALFVSAVGYCLPALLALSGMSNGIEWLVFSPLCHAAALCQTQGTNAAGAPYNLLWVPIFLVVVAAALAWAIGNDLTEAYEWAGVDLDAL